jgi:hypothetical protein
MKSCVNEQMALAIFLVIIYSYVIFYINIAKKYLLANLLKLVILNIILEFFD